MILDAQTSSFHAQHYHPQTQPQAQLTKPSHYSLFGSDYPLQLDLHAIIASAAAASAPVVAVKRPSQISTTHNGCVLPPPGFAQRTTSTATVASEEVDEEKHHDVMHDVDDRVRALSTSRLSTGSLSDEDHSPYSSSASSSADHSQSSSASSSRKGSFSGRDSPFGFTIRVLNDGSASSGSSDRSATPTSSTPTPPATANTQHSIRMITQPASYGAKQNSRSAVTKRSQTRRRQP